MRLPKIDFKNVNPLAMTDRSFGKGGMPLAIRMAALVAVALGHSGQGMVDHNSPKTPTGAASTPRA